MWGHRGGRCHLGITPTFNVGRQDGCDEGIFPGCPIYTPSGSAQYTNRFIRHNIHKPQKQTVVPFSMQAQAKPRSMTFTGYVRQNAPETYLKRHSLIFLYKRIAVGHANQGKSDVTKGHSHARTVRSEAFPVAAMILDCSGYQTRSQSLI